MPIACKPPSTSTPTPPPTQPTTAQTAAYIESHNRAVGLMGRFEFDAAATAFEAIAKSHPDDPDVRTNLAIAILNRQLEGDSAKAMELIDAVLAKHPTHARAKYCRGILLLHAGKPAEALEAFRAVANTDPTDAYARYHVGQCLLAENKPAEAHPEFESALAIDPRLRSAYYGAFQCLQRTGKPEQAKARLAEFQQLKENPQARLVEFKYTRMGAKAEVYAFDFVPVPRPSRPRGEIFARAAPLELTNGENLKWRSGIDVDDPTPTITAADIDGDGRIDLFITRAFQGGSQPENAVLLRRDRGFGLQHDHPLAAVAHVNAALWGDFDNDGLLDVYLCRRGPNQLWRQAKPQQWQDVTESARASGGDYDTVDGSFVDADHDGDLDLVLIRRSGPTELLSNNLYGTFRAIGKDAGIAGDGREAVGLVLEDLDRDADADLIVLKKQPPHDVWVNERAWKYGTAAGFDAFRTAPATAAVAGDRDADGQVEIYTAAPGAFTHWTRTGAGAWTTRGSNMPTPLLRWERRLAVADAGGTGMPDLFQFSEVGWYVASLHYNPSSFIDTDRPLPGASAAVVVLDPTSGPAVIALANDGKPPIVWNPGPGRHAYAALSLTGKHNQADQMRSNASGIGVHLAARVGRNWTTTTTLRNSSGPGQSLQPVCIGLGGATKADFITITWPDGLRQTELDVPAGKLTVIPETQRQTSSCPVIFAWDGKQFSFITDCLGVGGIGFALGPPGEYVPPRPWENVLLPAELLQPKDGEYRLKLSEPMEEACYLDAAKLVAYDIPPNWSITLDERMGVNDPQPTGKPVFYRQTMIPTSATNDRAEDVTAAVTQVDHVAAYPGKRDPRFLGFCREHSITLRFDEPIDQRPGDPTLIIDGWVEYPYSQTMFAAWQAGVAYEAPTLEARADGGQWVTVLEHFGYPAGMPRQMSVPIARNKLPPRTKELRIRTNIEVYWDRIALAFAEPCPDARRIELPLARATLAETGFARRHNFPQRRPGYDYAKRDPLWDAAHQDGFYTAFGRVDELLAKPDDALAIFGPGEEIDLAFTADRFAPPEGWTRRHVLELHGWCKDRDLHTKDGQTLEPLPTRHPTTQPTRDHLHAKYNTRYRSGGAGR